MRKRTCKLFAAIITLALILNLGIADTLGLEDPGNHQDSVKESQYSLKEIPENISKLVEDSKTAIAIKKDQEEDLSSLTTINSDGTYTVTLFSTPVKYKDDKGESKLIDTSMVSNGLLKSAFSGYEYKNKANSFVTEFSKSPQKGIKITHNNFVFDMSLFNTSSLTKASAKIESETTALGYDDAFVYENAFGEDTEVKYYNTYTGVKEDIVLYKNIGKNRFDFLINTNGDVPMLNDDASMVHIVNKDNPDEVKYSLASLYAEDSYKKTQLSPTGEKDADINSDINGVNSAPTESETVLSDISGVGGLSTSEQSTSSDYGAGQVTSVDSQDISIENTEKIESDPETALEPVFDHTTTDCYYELEDLGGSNYKVTVVVSEEYLNHPETVYPVIIDPTVYAANSAGSVEDTYVRQSAPTANYGSEDKLRIGNYNGTDYTSGRCHTYIRFMSLPSIGSNFVTLGLLKVKLRSGQTTAHPASVWPLTSEFYENQVTWNNRPSNGRELVGYVSHNNVTGYDFNVTSWLQDIADTPTPDYGFLINYTDASIPDLNSLYSSDCGNASLAPSLSFTYSSTPPVEDGVYFIRNLNSGLYLDVAYLRTAPGSVVSQYAFNGGANQQWKVVHQGNGVYKLYTMLKQDMVLDMAYNSATGRNEAQIHGDGGYNCKFKLLRNIDNSSYRFMASSNSYSWAMVVQNASASPGANIFTNPYNGTRNEHWVLEKNNDVVYSKLNELHNLANAYTSDAAYARELVFQYLRSVYNDQGIFDNFYWEQTAGTLNNNFISYVNSRNSTLSFLKSNNAVIYDRQYGPVDLPHLGATANTILNKSNSGLNIIYGQTIVDNLSGWAGDLQSLVSDTIIKTDGSETYSIFYAKFYSMLGTPSQNDSVFSMPDLLADLDAKYIAENINSSLIGDQFRTYYTSSIYHDRFLYFVGGRTREQFKSYVSYYIYNGDGGSIWPLYSFKGAVPTRQQSDMALDAFVTYIWNKQ